MAKEHYSIVSYGASPKSFATVSVNDFNVRDNLTAHQMPISSKHSLAIAFHPSPENGKSLVCGGWI